MDPRPIEEPITADSYCVDQAQRLEEPEVIGPLVAQLSRQLQEMIHRIVPHTQLRLDSLGLESAPDYLPTRQRKEHQYQDDKRQQDPPRPVDQKRDQAPPGNQQVSKEAGNHKKCLHAKHVDPAKEVLKPLVAARIGPRVKELLRLHQPRRMKCQTQEHHPRTQRIQRVESFRLAVIAAHL